MCDLAYLYLLECMLLKIIQRIIFNKIGHRYLTKKQIEPVSIHTKALYTCTEFINKGL